MIFFPDNLPSEIESRYGTESLISKRRLPFFHVLFIKVLGVKKKKRNRVIVLNFLTPFIKSTLLVKIDRCCLLSKDFFF